MVEIPEVVYAQMRRHGEESYPEECCGILLGVVEGDLRRVSEVVAAENVTAGSPRSSYSIAPIEVVRAMRSAGLGGTEVVGFYHSHPDHAAVWSETDLAEAHWLGSLYVIAEVAAGRAEETRAFLLAGTGEKDKRFLEEGIRVAG